MPNFVRLKKLSQNKYLQVNISKNDHCAMAVSYSRMKILGHFFISTPTFINTLSGAKVSQKNSIKCNQNPK